MKRRMENTDKTFRLRFDLQSFLIFVFLFFVEVCIALFVNDSIIRPYGGDFLVVIMMYYFFKSFIKIKFQYLLLFVLLLAYLVELCQLFDVVGLLGLQDNKVMSTIIGTSFSWGDMIAYTLGVGLCFVVELVASRRLRK